MSERLVGKKVRENAQRKIVPFKERNAKISQAKTERGNL